MLTNIFAEKIIDFYLIAIFLTLIGTQHVLINNFGKITIFQNLTEK